eukprot:2151289-Amphidinium_carterae.1
MQKLPACLLLHGIQLLIWDLQVPVLNRSSENVHMGHPRRGLAKVMGKRLDLECLLRQLD